MTVIALLVNRAIRIPSPSRKHAGERSRRPGKLGAILFQYAPWVMYGKDSRTHIDECTAQLTGELLAVEFRHQSWFAGKHADATLSLERDRGLVNVIVGEPNVTHN